MAASAKKKEHKFKLGGENIRFIIYILLAAVCVALFLIFGKGNKLSPSSTDASPSPIPEPSAVPKGATMSGFIRSLKESEMQCEIGEAVITSEHEFSYPLSLPDERDGAKLDLKTDALGRVIECSLELSYLYAGEPDSSYSEATASAIKAEYRKREKADTAIVSSFLDCIFAQLSEDCNIPTIDGKKIADSIESAYYSLKSYDKKAGGARFYCETENAEDNEFFFTFRVIASFDYSK